MQKNSLENNPWKIIGEKHIYDNPWIQLTEFDVLNAAGNKGIYGKIHFKNLAIGIIPLDKDFNTWLVGQYRALSTRSTLGFRVCPAGCATCTSIPLHCAQLCAMEGNLRRGESNGRMWAIARRESTSESY